MKKKILFFAITLCSGLYSFSQQPSMTVNTRKTTFGVRAGMNFQNINGKDGAGNKLQHDLTTGFNAGINAEMPLGGGMYLQPGILFTQKGAKLEQSSDKVKLNYIDIPVNLVYKPILGKGNMVLGFGPYVGFGLGGKREYANTESDVTFSNETVSSLDYSRFKKVDAGANFLAGYEFSNKLSLQLNTQLGLLDINPESIGSTSDKVNWRNTGWGISIGYRF
jgi:hypothetical protein